MNYLSFEKIGEPVITKFLRSERYANEFRVVIETQDSAKDDHDICTASPKIPLAVYKLHSHSSDNNGKVWFFYMFEKIVFA